MKKVKKAAKSTKQAETPSRFESFKTKGFSTKNAVLSMLVAVQAVMIADYQYDNYKLNQPQYEPKTCLMEKTGLSAVVVGEVDVSTKTYKGAVLVAGVVFPATYSFSELNSRKDLKKVNCETGAAL